MEHVVSGRLMSTTAVCRRTGLTFRMLDYWVRANAIWPAVEAEGSGTHRGWTDDDALRLRAIALMLSEAKRNGLSVSTAAIADAWDTMTRGEAWGVALIAAPAEVRLLDDDRKVTQ